MQPIPVAATATATATAVWLPCRLVSLTGVVSPEDQQRELFGDAQADRLTAAGSTSALPRAPPASPPPVEQRLAPLPPHLAAGAADAAAGEELEEEGEEKDKDL